ncbi:MFS transporter [Aurantimonas endophytica]|uniref:MFS family permease n=1 Tax=Aurantimonas endophytica TaxID=1522175 RepID=A0A7W6HHU2_9HYPH|nr:MFS transporter [Aurantimonas endophytica]MBB4005530.1 MFS family permease [Aurantimonas endophytica]MCO6406496.1 MFS transporter [Aurantimonas endophytica]
MNVDASTTGGDKLDWRVILPVFLSVSLYAASAAAALPILPFYLKEMGGTPLIFGVVIATEALTQFVAAPLVGQLSDRLGRKKILLATQAAAFTSFLLLALAKAVFPVLLARMLFGLTGGTLTAAVAYAADYSSPANRRQAIGTLNAAVGLGGIVGAGLTGYLSDISLTVPIYAAMALSAASLAVTTIWIKGSHAASNGVDESTRSDASLEKVSFRSFVSSPLIRVLVIVLLCYFFAYGMFSSQIANYLQVTFISERNSFGPRELGYIMAADGAINIIVQLFLLQWIGRYFTERRLIVLICAIVAVGYITVGFATTLPILVLAVFCVGVGDALARPTFLSALSVHAPRERQGIVLGTTQSLLAATEAVTPVIAGFLIGRALYGFWTGLIIAFVAIAAVITWTRLPSSDPEVEGQASPKEPTQ